MGFDMKQGIGQSSRYIMGGLLIYVQQKYIGHDLDIKLTGLNFE